MIKQNSIQKAKFKGYETHSPEIIFMENIILMDSLTITLH